MYKSDLDVSFYKFVMDTLFTSQYQVTFAVLKNYWTKQRKKKLYASFFVLSFVMETEVVQISLIIHLL